MTKTIVALLIVVSACGKSPCKQAAQHMVDLASKDDGKVQTADMAKVYRVIGDALAGSCEQDKWSPKAIDCITTAADVKVARECEHELTPAQRKASEEAVQNAFKDGKTTVSDVEQISGDDTIKQITDQRDRLCACTDAACAEAIDKEWRKLKRSSERARHEDPIKEQFNKIDDERFKCYLKLTGKK